MSTSSKLVITIIIFILILLFIWFVSTPAQQEQALSFFQIDADDEVIFIPSNEPAPQPVLQSSLGYYPPSAYKFTHSSVNFCQTDGIKNPSKAEKGTIFKWEDEDGQVHFSDQQPSNEKGVVRIGDIFINGNKYFSLSLIQERLRLSAIFKEKLNRSIRSIFKFFSQNLVQNFLEPIHVNLRIINGQRNYKRFIARHSYRVSASTTNGFYTPRNNLAVVKWLSKKRTLQVTQHEISHLIIGNIFGNTQTWFNEGLAEFTERIRAEGNARVSELDKTAITRLSYKLKHGSLPSLKWLLTSSRSSWKKAGVNEMYEYSWSIVFYLMSHQEGKVLLTDYLKYVSDNKCEPIDTIAFFNTNYATGVNGLEKNWKKWLVEGNKFAVTL
jgi:hypothetical protein